MDGALKEPTFIFIVDSYEGKSSKRWVLRNSIDEFFSVTIVHIAVLEPKVGQFSVFRQRSNDHDMCGVMLYGIKYIVTNSY
jgi:hypothetical protein